MFYGREELLTRYEQLWRKQVPSFVVCRGRRRIGKSTLIAEFARRSGGLYLKFEGLAPDEHMTNRKQLAAFRDQLEAQSGLSVPLLKSWAEAFRQLNRLLAGEGRKVVLFDEVSWMGGYDTTFPAQLKVAWDNLFHNRSDLIVFVCGSVSAWIHKNILKSKGFVGRISLDTVVPELPLCECVKFWRGRARRLSAREILDVLSVTGGVPRYLEEIDPGVDADENIRRLCFQSDGYLFREFAELFNDIVSRTAPTKRKMLELLAEGPASGADLAHRMGIARNSHLSDILKELETAGFIDKADGINPATGKRGRVDRYRLRDNYVRFFLRYVAPHLAEIKSGAYAFSGLGSLAGWHALMGLQFENLVLNNLTALLPLLNLQGKTVISAAPFRSRAGKNGGIQVDLLIQTDGVAYIVEIKRGAQLGIQTAREIAHKAETLPIRSGMSVRTALVYAGHLSKDLLSSDSIDLFIPVEKLL